MKKISFLRALVLLALTLRFDASSDGLLKSVTNRIGQPGDVLEIGAKERQEKLVTLKKERGHLEAAKASFDAEIQTKTADIERRLAAIRDTLKLDPENDFLIKSQSVFNEWFQILKEQQKARDEMLAHIDERIIELAAYVGDPSFEVFKREQRIAGISGRSFDYLQGINQKIIDLKRALETLAEQEKSASIELENRKRILAAVNEAYRKKSAELSGSLAAETSQEPFGMNGRQRGELATLEEKLYKDKSHLEEMRLADIEHKRAAIAMGITTSRAKLEILKNIFNREKSSIRVTELDLVVAQDDLAKHKQQSFAVIDALQKEIDDYDTKEARVQEASKRLDVALGHDLDAWSRQPIKNSASLQAFFEVGLINAQSLLAKREKDLLEARKALEQEQLSQEALQVDIKESYYRITTRKFKSEADIAAEIKKYAVMHDDAVATRVHTKNKNEACAAAAEAQRKALGTLHERVRDLKRLRESLFKGNLSAYAHLAELVRAAETAVKNHIKILEETRNVYDEISAKINAKILQLDFIVEELEEIKWYRSEYAITLKDIRSIGADVSRFARDVASYVTHVSPRALWATITSVFDTRLAWLVFFARVLALIAALLVIIAFLPRLAREFVRIGRNSRGLKTVSLIFAVVAGFFVHYKTVIIPWLIVYIVGQIYAIPDPYTYVIFYLLSIPLFIVLSRLFVVFLKKFNVQHGYALLSADFQERFALIFVVLLYATTIIFLFREAFVTVNYLKSELPTILLAANVIIVQLALILLLSKEQILHIIPPQSSLGEWVYKRVDTYYNIILLAVVTLIILSNPYVGFGRYILRIVLRAVMTVVCAQILILAHNFIKQALASFFFSTKDEAVRERFSYAKTWYGVFVVAILVIFLAAAVIMGAKVWHWPPALVKINTWDDIRSWLGSPIFMEGSEHPISIFSLVYLVAFILGGMFFAFVFDRFVLHRIFDVLLVEHGVQNAVSSLTRYCIIVIAIILAVQAVGLGGQAWYLMAALMLGVGWVIKDPAYDFISYFIILIQRPVKIGDYVRFDEDVRGIVRRITPRAVILRRRNSATIFVPNSQVLNKSFANWNYGRGFIAFDDIFLTVDYREDPVRVRALLLEVLASSHYVLKSPAPVVRLYRFGTYGFVFQIRGFLSSSYTLDMWDIASDMRLAIAASLRKNGITIAALQTTGTFLPATAEAAVQEFQEHRQRDE